MTQTEQCKLLLNWNCFCACQFFWQRKKIERSEKNGQTNCSQKEVGWIISLDQLHFFSSHTLYTTHTMRRIVYNQPYTFIYIKSHNKTSLEAKRFLHDECQCLLGTACSVCLYIPSRNGIHNYICVCNFSMVIQALLYFFPNKRYVLLHFSAKKLNV